MDAERGREGRSVPCGRFPSLFAASVWSVREAARRQFRLLLVFAIASSFRFKKPLERPIAPLVATASAVAGQGGQSIEILRGPSGNTCREGSVSQKSRKATRGVMVGLVVAGDRKESVVSRVGLLAAGGAKTPGCSR
jgi:hypothetical protein